MYVVGLIFATLLGFTLSAPQAFETKSFKVGIEYEHSSPLCGGSDRYRHRNNYDPFFVTVTANAKKGYVFSFVEVTASVDEGGLLDFNLVKGNTGSKTLMFQLVSNRSDFLKYSYLAYGIKEEEYKKVALAAIPYDAVDLDKSADESRPHSEQLRSFCSAQLISNIIDIPLPSAAPGKSGSKLRLHSIIYLIFISFYYFVL
ncbi:hypothetical protein NE865_09501 [Phthorimaea operculella]|nr:hypothetical protein NE865_09501 [Phthorimaea operculella]